MRKDELDYFKTRYALIIQKFQSLAHKFRNAILSGIEICQSSFDFRLDFILSSVLWKLLNNWKRISLFQFRDVSMLSALSSSCSSSLIALVLLTILLMRLVVGATIILLLLWVWLLILLRLVFLEMPLTRLLIIVLTLLWRLLFLSANCPRIAGLLWRRSYLVFVLLIFVFFRPFSHF